MGLFSNNKKLCPICGGPTPRLLATKVEGTPICNECYSKVDLPDGALGNMSMDDFRRYIMFYEDNQRLRDAFTETYRFDYGFFGSKMVLDTHKGLIRLKDDANALVLEASCLTGFRITEDGSPLFEGGRDALRCYQSTVPERVSAMSMQIEMYARQKREYERRERMNGDNGNHYSPTFDIPEPFRKFVVELTFNHPYWGVSRKEWGGPTFNNSYPSINDYLREYNEKVDKLRELAHQLMGFLNPDAPMQSNTGMMGMSGFGAGFAPAQTVAAPEMDAVGEIQRYKSLLDAGIITEEEFAAKKRQLLGI